MAQDMRLIGYRSDLPTAALEMICSLVINTMLNAASDILDLPADQPQLARELEENFISQIRLVFLGAEQWRAETAASHKRRSEEHTSELQSLMRISYAVFCLKKKTKQKP